MSADVEQLLMLVRQVDLDDVFAIVADVELFVRVYVELFIAFFANGAPDWQSVDVHLIPVMILHCIHESLVLLFCQLHHACHCILWNIIFEVDSVTAKLQLDSFQRF